MITFFPNKIASKYFYIYLGILAVVSFIFMRYAMNFEYMLLGAIWVGGFMFGSSYCTRRWARIDKDIYIRRVFWIAVGLRFVWVIISYFYYKSETGIPFEFSAADSIGYHGDAEWLANQKFELIRKYLIEGKGISDSGYLFYLTYLYKIIGPNIFLTRVIKCVISAFTCVLLYKLTRRIMGESVGRIVGIFAMLFPNLIFYCGLHLKETEMLFLIVAYIERADNLLRERNFKWWNIVLVALLAISLFSFRTVLGAVAVFSFISALVFAPTKIVSKGRRAILIGWTVLAILVLAGGTIATEIEGVWENRMVNQSTKRTQQTLRGNQWAQYATGTVMAPMMFTLPFPTMIDVDEQYTQQMLGGGNFVKNCLSIFVVIALYLVFFVKKNWRNFALIGSFEIGYLGVICMSGFANAERFLLPGVPMILVMAAYGLANLDTKRYQWVKIWYWVLPVIAFGWAFFKLGSRGLF